MERRAPPPVCASLEFCLAHARAQGGWREAARGQEWEGKDSKSAVRLCASAVNLAVAARRAEAEARARRAEIEAKVA